MQKCDLFIDLESMREVNNPEHFEITLSVQTSDPGQCITQRGGPATPARDCTVLTSHYGPHVNHYCDKQSEQSIYRCKQKSYYFNLHVYYIVFRYFFWDLCYVKYNLNYFRMHVSKIYYTALILFIQIKYTNINKNSSMIILRFYFKGNDVIIFFYYFSIIKVFVLHFLKMLDYSTIKMPGMEIEACDFEFA